MNSQIYLRAVALWIGLFPSAGFADRAFESYEEATARWMQTKGSPEYQEYASEFAQFNNHFKIDTSSDCYAMGADPVGLMLVITRQDGDAFAIVDRVFAETNSAKSSCFRKVFTGVQTKVPPFFPFVLQMDLR